MTTSTSNLPAAYVNELNTLNREITKNQPSDVLQFCANFFNKRLESQRAEFLLSTSNNASGSSASAFGHFGASGRASPGYTGGGESSFPGFNTSSSNFGSAPSPPSVHTGIGPDTRIEEEREDELDDIHQSPTSNTFQHNVFGPNPSMAEQVARIANSPPVTNNTSNTSNTLSPRGRFADLPNSGGPPNSFRSPSPSKDFPSNYNMTRRTSVSAESMVPSSSSEEWTPPVYSKTPEQMNRLKGAIANNFLFMHLDEDQSSQVLGALVEKIVPHKDTRIITQGDVGDFFYIVEKGDFDIFVNKTGIMQPGKAGYGDKVSTIGPGGSFGELALMYNAPRAATIMTTGRDSILWALDRVTFRRILMENTFKRRRMYEAFLETVPILSSLVPYERAKIADALDTVNYPADAVIIKEGDPGDNFYIIESGTAEVRKRETGSKALKTLGKGDYFGELALLNDAPRAASIVAKDKMKIATLDKDGFQRLLGPVTEIMIRNDPTKMDTTADTAPKFNTGGFSDSYSMS